MSNKTSDNSVANIEENIKTIKNLLQMLENGFLTEEMCPIRSWDPTPKYASALKYILAEREQKDKRIKELEEDLTDSIPKQVVIDKIEEYFEDEEWLIEHDLRALCDDEKECREYYINKKIALKDIKKNILDKFNKLLNNY